MRLCWDASSITRLSDDPQGPIVLEELGKHANHTSLTGINIAELGATPDPARRESLIRTAGRLSPQRPLLFPPDLLRETLRAYAAGETADVTLGERQEGLIAVLGQPELVRDDAAREEVANYNTIQKASYEVGMRAARAFFLEHLESLPGEQRQNFPSALSLLKYIRRTDAFPGFVESWIEAMGLAIPELLQKPLLVVRDIAEWRSFFVGQGIGIYNRVFRRERYGARHHAGGLDTQQIIYLAHCDVFVADDRGLREALGIARHYMRPRPKVLTYRELTQELGASHDGA